MRAASFALAAAALASTLLAAPPAEPRPQPLTARVAPGVYHLGNLVPLEISAPLNTPAFYVEGDLTQGADWGSARISNVTAVTPQAFPGTLVLKVQIQVFATGTVHLPPLPLTIRTGDRKQAYLLTVPNLTIQALLPPGNQPEPPPAALLGLPRPVPWGWIVLGISLLLAAILGVLAYLKRRRHRPPAANEPPSLRNTDPDRWIREEVDRLFRSSMNPEERYGTLSQRLRDYLELKTGLPYLEWTTSEVQAGLRQMRHLSPERATDLMGILSLCDWVCFARYYPEAREESDTRERALRFTGAVAIPPPSKEGAA